MIDYVNDVAALPQVGAQPAFCWVRDFQAIEDGNDTRFSEFVKNLVIPDQTFEERLDLLLSFPVINDVYGADIAIDPETGKIEASRCHFTVNGVDVNGVKEQIDMLADQRQVSLQHPVNQGRERFAFFSFDVIYFIWVSALKV